MIGQELLSLLYGDPASQISRTLNPNPVNPSPGAAGGPPGAGGAPGPPPQPALPPAQATQSPPDLAALYTQLHQQDRAANQIDRGTALMASAFGTAQQQHDMMDYAIHGVQPMDDRAGMLGNILKDQATLKQQQDLAQFQAGAAGMQSMFPDLTPQQLQWLSKNPAAMNDLIAARTKGAEPTEAMKNANAAGNLYATGKGYDVNNLTPEQKQDVDNYKSSLISGAVGGQTPVEKDLRNDIRMWQASHPGGTPEQMYAEHPGWTTLTGYAAEKAEQTKTAAQAATDKLQSKANLTDVEKTMQPIAANIDKLLGNINDTATAVQRPQITTGNVGQAVGALSGVIGPIAGVDQNVLDMRNALDQLKAQLSGEGMKNMKNIRTQREFDTIAGAASGPIFSQTASKNQIQQALQDLKAKFGLAHANATAAAGGQVPAEYGDQVGRDYLDKTSPLYNGATVEPTADLSKMSEADADAAVEKLPPGAPYRGPDGKLRRK